MNEVSYYPELAETLEATARANVTDYEIGIKAMFLPRDGSNIRSFLQKYVAEYRTSEALHEYAQDVPKLKTDIVLIFDNPKRNKFQIVIIEAKLLGSAGLTQLSQLLGYCLVSKAAFGLLVNINGGVSNDLAGIIATDRDLTNITRTTSNYRGALTHKIGMMSYSSTTRNLSYIHTSAISSFPNLVQQILGSL